MQQTLRRVCLGDFQSQVEEQVRQVARAVCLGAPLGAGHKLCLLHVRSQAPWVPAASALHHQGLLIP